MTYYVGLLDGEPGSYGVRIPDCPGALGAGDTTEAAIGSAISGLALWAEETAKDGDALPTPRSAADIKVDPKAGYTAERDAVVMVPLLLDAGRTVRANLTMDAGLLALVDAEAQRRGITRSAFFASAAREKIAEAR